MSAPVFFVEVVSGTEDLIELSEETSRHIVQVLRMKPGETLQLTNGKGLIITADIQVDHKKKCVVKVQKVRQEPPPERTISIAISLIKNAHRFEWFLEKATEIGVSHIIPLLCGRTEKQHFRLDRMKSILVSAIDLSRDWTMWRDGPASVVLRPEHAWEGANAPRVPSVRSSAYGTVNQLRDPAIFEEDGRIFLLYAVAGESGIAIAELFINETE